MNPLKTFNVCFFGKTGYGKSSLINGLFGTQFSTAPFHSCTKELYTVTTMADAPKGYEAVTVYDTPGIGEFPDNDVYQRYYDHAISVADVVVLVVTFARTDAPEQEMLIDLKKHLDETRNTRFVIALNHIDSSKVAMDSSYEPWDEENNRPSDECMAIVEERVRIIHEKFDELFMPSVVVPVCAMRGYGIDDLKRTILTL
jgi:small GTP-binding protein